MTRESFVCVCVTYRMSQQEMQGTSLVLVTTRSRVTEGSSSAVGWEEHFM